MGCQSQILLLTTMSVETDVNTCRGSFLMRKPCSHVGHQPSEPPSHAFDPSTSSWHQHSMGPYIRDLLNYLSSSDVQLNWMFCDTPNCHCVGNCMDFGHQFWVSVTCLSEIPHSNPWLMIISILCFRVISQPRNVLLGVAFLSKHSNMP